MTDISAVARDERYMRIALGLAARGLGNTWPNPAVGCVIVKDDRIVGRGWTQPGGRPHAETMALREAGDTARGATAYVTLEPCSHHGKTPPCADALIEAGIARCVAAVEDPDPRVSGKGFAALREAGIQVDEGCLEIAAMELNAGFFSTRQLGRPMITLKLAVSLDGRIGTHTGDSKWITNPVSRMRAHLLRARHDAIMVGSNTALQDDPELTCRLPGLPKRPPVRIILDGRLRLSLTARMVVTAKQVPTWLITREDVNATRRRAFEDCGVEVIAVEPDEAGFPDLRQALEQIAQRGVTRILVEGGGRLAASLVRADLVDRMIWFRSPSIIGGDGLPSIAAFGVDAVGEAPRWRRMRSDILDDDLLETFVRAH
ncbi:bifunctional diaminohydroxyphosphoribosylaminopyrimidine deaminase/5-amino-6-(5-phosphoribosylamino)uracil reductase RibD [uncultured Ferrovibrio sp.]|jgi:diaminohydroxyphosphoribosylaminopyrimidine deaminase/5-amino-6-(5-phosphoribosylamino)uracil reductase|uniref:bifunctional diaminohydroxyphosphoribosylaminopyrimidine deaminase/5-amino-6-(5-phosphoribosylamino)uracil reductase RibD n=1 Tax=uncultured Ferrovibrio sp. TaxID=1576913 RepID=UPI0026262944|nr:bifunctional diaminohydroxyphosphoribosylaminopyrimidine deaminase/5-amino-6-(5-phosphoribosylamino)uracil reductase RibD [uncultured Ferrovibrio sp.]